MNRGVGKFRMKQIDNFQEKIHKYLQNIVTINFYFHFILKRYSYNYSYIFFYFIVIFV